MPNRINQTADPQSLEDLASLGAAAPEASSTECYPITTVRINSLVFKDSPRLSGENPEHTRVLAETTDDLPPITVHRPTMQVIDGMHRVKAALLNGESVIEARFLDCDEETAFVLAVKANVTHGLPLSQQDRKAAAARITATYPHWSDRAVAAATGLSGKTVARIRECATAEIPQLRTRVGRDGRSRPVSTESRRLQAAAMISEKPEAGLREVARATGLSPATVRDVRARIDRAEDPVPQRYRPADNLDGASVTQLPRKPSSRARHLGGQVNPHKLLAKLKNDPSLRFNEAGRQTLRWLHQHIVHIESWENHERGVPDHCAPVVADLARSCADAWTKLAEQLEQRVHIGAGAVSENAKSVSSTGPSPTTARPSG